METLKHRLLLSDLGQPIELIGLSLDELIYLHRQHVLSTWITSNHGDINKFDEYEHFCDTTIQTFYCRLPFQITTPNNTYVSTTNKIMTRWQYVETKQLVLKEFFLCT